MHEVEHRHAVIGRPQAAFLHETARRDRQHRRFLVIPRREVFRLHVAPVDQVEGVVLVAEDERQLKSRELPHHGDGADDADLVFKTGSAEEYR